MRGRSATKVTMSDMDVPSQPREALTIESRSPSQLRLGHKLSRITQDHEKHLQSVDPPEGEPKGRDDCSAGDRSERHFGQHLRSRAGDKSNGDSLLLRSTV